MNLKKNQILVKSLIAVATVILLASCGELNSPSPFAPEVEYPATLAKSGPGKNGSSSCDSATVANSNLLLVRKRDDDEEGMTSMVIGPAGGTLIHAKHSVVIPPGALQQNVTITFEIPVSDTLMFELGPDGIQFQKPVQVIFDYDNACKKGLDQELFGAVYWDPNAQAWKSVSSTVDTELNTVTANTAHFSRYALTKS